MVLATDYHPRDGGGISVDTSLEKTRSEKVWKHKHPQTAQSRSICIQIGA